MIRKNELSKALDGAFRAAFMLTGCTQPAAHAVLDGIAATEFDNAVGDVFLLETVKAAILIPPSGASAAVSTRADLSRLFRIANSPTNSCGDLLKDSALQELPRLGARSRAGPK